jgi:DNA-binding FrmR family transcriptional regulator
MLEKTNLFTNTMDQYAKIKISHRLKRIEGQVRGLIKLVENNTYCIDIITQTSAVKQGLSNVEDVLLEDHLGHCVISQMQSGQIKKVKEEIIKVYKLKRK